jgi:hypothetical protein
VFGDVCEWGGCTNKSTRLAAKPESGIIDICDSCWHLYYRS